MNICCECDVTNQVIKIYSGTRFIGYMRQEDKDYSPTLDLFANMNGVVSLTTDEIYHILDNWNEMMGMKLTLSK
jgi:hypothetical protein